MNRKNIDKYVQLELQATTSDREKKSWEVMKKRLDQRSPALRFKRIIYITTLVVVGISAWFVWAVTQADSEQNPRNKSGQTAHTKKTVGTKQTLENSELNERNIALSSSVQIKDPEQTANKSFIPETHANVIQGTGELNASVNLAEINKPISNSKKTTDLTFQPDLTYIDEKDGEKNIQAKYDILIDTAEREKKSNDAITYDTMNQRNSVVSNEIVTEEINTSVLIPESLSEENTIEFNEISPRLQLLVFAGPQWSVRNLRGSDQVFIDKLNENESQINTVEAGLNLSYNLTNNTNLITGLNYFSIEQNMVYDGWIDSTISIKDNSYWEPLNSNRWIYTDSIRDNLNPSRWIYTDSILKTIKDSVLHEIIDTGYIVESNEGFTGKKLIYQLEIPILVAFEFKKGRYNFGFQTGIGITYLVYRSGPVYLQNGEFKESSSFTYYKSWNFNAHFGLYADYRLSDKIAIGIEPHLRLPLNSILKNEDIYLNFTNYSIRLRLRYYF